MRAFVRESGWRTAGTRVGSSTTLAALGLLALPALAAAQTVSPPPNAAPAPAITDMPTAAGGGEIIVTAQRRSERLRDVPISITALSADTLIKSGVNNTLDIARITPGLELPLYGGFLQPAIRGISSAGAGLGDSSNVAVYVDGVYQPSESGQLMDLPDIQQIEVLKGPQGTLYGQNAAGGAIIVRSVTPSFTPTGRISASYGSYDDKAFRGYVTGPLTETVAASIAGGYEDRDGFRRDLLRGGRGSGLQSRLMRGRLLWRPSDRVSFTLGAYYTHRSDGDVYAGEPVGPGTPLGYALAGLARLTVPHTVSPNETATNLIPKAVFTTYGVSLLGEFTTGAGTISTVTAYGNVKVRNTVDIDYTATNVGDEDLRINQHDFVQEVNFTSERFGRARVAAGLFYLANREDYVPQLFNGYFTAVGDPVTVYPATPAPLFVIPQYATNKKRSYAAYAELTYDLTDALTVSVAGRYSYEQQRTYNGFAPEQVPANPNNPFTFKKFTPRATARYKLDDRSNLYATYSQGFKSGFANVGDFNDPAVRPEVVYAYEVGYKGRPLDWLTLNLAAFHYDYKNLQVFVYVPPVGIYENAASARINGFDFDATATLTRNLTITAGASVLHARYRRYPNAGVYTPNAFGFGNDFAEVDASGHHLPRAPKFTANLAANYGIDTSSGRIGLYASGAYSSGITYDPIGAVRQGRHATINGELSFAPSALHGLRLIVWTKNLTNQHVLSSVLESQFVYGGSYAEPRTFGGRVEFQF